MQSISTLPYLSLSVWLPIVFGVIVLALGRDNKAGFTRVLSLIGAVVSFLPTIPLLLATPLGVRPPFLDINSSLGDSMAFAAMT